MLKWIQGGLSAVTGIAEPEYGKEYIHPATERVVEEKRQPFVELKKEDVDWINPDHTNVETATFYFSNLDTGVLGFAQIIHSNIIGYITQAQFTFRIYDSRNPGNLNLWTSTKLENFKIEGPNFYADNLSLELNEENTEYHFVSSVNDDSKIDLTFTRLVPGVKVGDNSTTYYGDNIEEPWGTMRHVFWPRNSVVGTIDLKKPIEVKSATNGESETQDNEEGQEENDQDESESNEEIQKEDINIKFTKEYPVYSLFIMAVQGMKPHHAAKTWNFLNFHSEEGSTVLIEFTTPKSYANTKVSIGIVTSKEDILAVTVDNNYEHLNSEVDEIGWKVPKNIQVTLNGIKSNISDEQVAGGELTDADKFTAVYEAKLEQLVERVDVMSEIPQFVKNIVSGIAGTKPYIYQYANIEDCTLKINEKSIKGLGWMEVTFISESDAITEESYNEN
ncbi:hypothetical protein TPHA_0H01580 [Tetrapisispora phaffii CBS 4417]|uniref:Survival factor 1 n=1 Tax=Tetrapisispora phaffii (strain ATCC 24235 / CBS 4417 / NBRC 1672 / NRRL Y-8282 / UCD 70-5) TaxID=1071381 RepID=G8BX60_TETPH|nr:hypothetical protein TPHA_0H01580 [Tetrapisispora phaffii CBS 4417]CCE64364.1 hypothetical protein TPHA_0H01580 [Tetrapisispora phaffii CBS 4417]